MLSYWEKGKMYVEYNVALTWYERNIILPLHKISALRKKILKVARSSFVKSY